MLLQDMGVENSNGFDGGTVVDHDFLRPYVNTGGGYLQQGTPSAAMGYFYAVI
jgi:hypothetical protein